MNQWFPSRRPAVLAAAALPLLLVGCAGAPANPAAVPATRIDPEQAEPPYWYARPAVASVASFEFETLWHAAAEAAKDAGFRIDREDFRGGVMTTRPLVSQQLFEPWKRDVASLNDLLLSTIDTTRRTVRFEFTRREDGGYDLVPKVLVERFAFTEHRITSVAQFREVFTLTREEIYRRRNLQLNPGQEPVVGQLPPDYWYATGRDPHMERRLADWITDRLRNAGPGPAKDTAS